MKRITKRDVERQAKVILEHDPSMSEEEARNDAERHDRQDSEHAPILYLKQGTYLVRPQLDSEDNLIRNFSQHSVKTDDGHYSCLCSGVGESCPVCQRRK